MQGNRVRGTILGKALRPWVALAAALLGNAGAQAQTTAVPLDFDPESFLREANSEVAVPTEFTWIRGRYTNYGGGRGRRGGGFDGGDFGGGFGGFGGEQTMSIAQLQELDAFRLEVVKFQRSVTEAQNTADTTVKRFGDVKKAATADSAKVTAALRTQMADVEKVLNAFTKEIGLGLGGRAAQFAARQAGGPGADDMEDENRGASGAPDMSFSARSGSLNSAVTASFPVSVTQRALLAKLRKELATQQAAMAKVKSDGLPALESSLKSAGVKLP